MNNLVNILLKGWKIDMFKKGGYYAVAARHEEKELYVFNWQHVFLKDAISHLSEQIFEAETIK